LTLLIVIHALICLFLVFIILLQPGKSDGGIGFGGSSSQSIFGSRGAGNFLTKTTSACAILFLVTSFILTRERIQLAKSSVIKPDANPPPATAPVVPTPGTPAPTEPGKAVQTPSKAEPAKPAAQKPAHGKTESGAKKDTKKQ